MSVDITSIPEDLQFEIICDSDGCFICSAAVQDRVIDENPAWLDRIDCPHTTAKFIAAIRNNPSHLKNFIGPPLPWQEAVLDADMSNIWHICAPEPTLVIAFLEHLAGVPRSNAVETTDEVKRLALAKDWRAIHYIEDPDDAMKAMALEQSWEAIKFIDEPSISDQLLACRSAEGARHLDFEGLLSDDQAVTTLAKKTLFDALTLGAPSERDSGYRNTFLDLATEEEILGILSGDGTEPAFEPSDFSYLPSDKTKIKVIQRIGLRKAFGEGSKKWLSGLFFFRKWLAGYRDGRLYGYSYLDDTETEEKAEFIKLLAGDSTSKNPLVDEKICKRAIRQSDISIIHAAFACIPDPSDDVCKVYLYVLADEWDIKSITPLSLEAAYELIRHCPDNRSSLQVAIASSRFNDRLRKICDLSKFLSDDDANSDALRVDYILKGIAAAIDLEANGEQPLVTIRPEDIDIEPF